MQYIVYIVIVYTRRYNMWYFVHQVLDDCVHIFFKIILILNYFSREFVKYLGSIYIMYSSWRVA